MGLTKLGNKNITKKMFGSKEIVKEVLNGVEIYSKITDPQTNVDFVRVLTKSGVINSSVYTQDEYQLTTGQAQEGIQYYIWDNNYKTIIEQQIGVGEQLPKFSFIYNENYSTSTGTERVKIVGLYPDDVFPQNLIMNGNDLSIYNGSTYEVLGMDMTEANAGNISNLELYNLSSSQITMDFQFPTARGNYMRNLSRLYAKNVNAKFKISYAYYGSASDNERKVAGDNVADGTDIIIEGNMVSLPQQFLYGGLLQSARIGYFSGSIHKIKSLTFNTPNLTTIGSECITSTILPTESTNINIPSTVTDIKQNNFGLFYKIDNIGYAKIKDSNQYWIAIKIIGPASGKISLSTPENTFGIAGSLGYATLTDVMTLSNITINDGVRYLSNYSIPVTDTDITLNSNIISGNSCLFKADVNNIKSLIIGSNVTSLPDEIFTSSKAFTNGITFNTPINTPISIGYHSLYFKSARAVTIYYNDPNNSITDYDWSANQNITATLTPLN